MAYEDYHVNADDVKLDGDPNIRRTVPPSPSGGGGGIAYGTCTTAAATAAKVVTLADATGWELKQGATICIKFTNTNTAQNPTLNVNNSGAKSVYYNTGLITTGSLWTAGEANRFTSFMYDGTNWVWIGSSVDRNTTYSAMSTSELTTGTATTSRVVRADYLKKGIEEIIKAPITDIVNVYGAKNLLPLSLQNIKALNTSGTWNDNSYTVSGVTYTVNVDTNGNITNIDVTGTASTNATLMLYGYSYSNTSTNIIFDNPIIASDNFNGSSTTARCIVWGTSSGYVDDEELYIPASTFYGCGIRIISGYVIPSNGITFYPMLRLASIQDDTYVPYAKTNKELTTDTSNIKDSVSSISITGTKNITGATIAEDTYFYLNGELVRSKADIASGATLTLNTNYEVTTAGGLNEVNSQLKDALINRVDVSSNVQTSSLISTTDSLSAVIIMNKIAIVCGNIAISTAPDSGISLLYGLPNPKGKPIVNFVGDNKTFRGYIDVNSQGTSVLHSYGTTNTGWFSFNLVYEID